MIFDSHAHLDMPQFDGDREDVIRRARDAGVDLIITIGTGAPDGDSIEKTLAIAERHDFVWAAIGVQPHDASLAGENYWEKLEAWAQHPKVVLWGEIGLEYHYDFSPREVQKQVLRRQLRSARRLKLPVSLHCRDAWEDLALILREEYAGETRGGILHSFTGNTQQALEAAALGLMISFSGIVTFPSAGSIRHAARELAPDRILVETDCPYLAPVPHRGKRNEPAWVVETARVLAGLKAMNYEDFARCVSANVRRLLGGGGKQWGTAPAESS